MTCPADMSLMDNETLYLSDCIGELNTDDISVEYLTIVGDSTSTMLSQPHPGVELVVLFRV